jgi:uncharacterized protein DUF6984
MDSEFRDLDTREKDLLEKLLEATTLGRVELRTQLDHVQAKQINDDGTLLLQCNGGTEVSSKHAPVADGVCKDADGADIALILHLGKGGFMKMLEIIKYDGSPILNPPSARDLVLLMPEGPGREPAENAGNAQ